MTALSVLATSSSSCGATLDATQAHHLAKAPSPLNVPVLVDAIAAVA